MNSESVCKKFCAFCVSVAAVDNVICSPPVSLSHTHTGARDALTEDACTLAPARRAALPAALQQLLRPPHCICGRPLPVQGLTNPCQGAAPQRAFTIRAAQALVPHTPHRDARAPSRPQPHPRGPGRDPPPGREAGAIRGLRRPAPRCSRAPRSRGGPGLARGADRAGPGRGGRRPLPAVPGRG